MKVSERTHLAKTAEIRSFIGHRQSEIANPLNMPLGQLIFNQNMEYLFSVNQIYLRTKRGSTLIKDIGNRSYGAHNYIYNLESNIKVWVDNLGVLKYLDDASNTIKTIKSGLGPEVQNYFHMYGLGTLSSLYGTNATNGVYKIDGETPSYTKITSPKVTHLAYSTVGKRFFGVLGHSINWTEQQISSDSLANLENWDVGTNEQPISPDSGTGFVASGDSGEAHFFWKDTGIWILPNPDEVPTNWRFPKANAAIGSKSPKTIKRVQYGEANGFIYLATDKTLRFFLANVVRNAGQYPTIEGGDARVISNDFQKYLDDIPTARLEKCTAEYWNRYYILTIPGANDSDVNFCIVIDTEKIITETQTEIPQPFWFTAPDMKYVDMFKEASTNTVYGIHKDGYMSQLFIDNKYHEEVPERIDSTEKLTIDWGAYTGWYKFSDTVLELNQGYLLWATEGQWNINFHINAFTVGEAVPDFDTGLTKALAPQGVSGSYFDIGLFDVARFGSTSGQLSQNVNISGKGNYFLFGFSGSNVDEWATVYGIVPLFKQTRVSPAGLR